MGSSFNDCLVSDRNLQCSAVEKRKFEVNYFTGSQPQTDTVSSVTNIFLWGGQRKRTLVREGDYEILMDYVGRLLSAQE